MLVFQRVVRLAPAVGEQPRPAQQLTHRLIGRGSEIGGIAVQLRQLRNSRPFRCRTADAYPPDVFVQKLQTRNKAELLILLGKIVEMGVEGDDLLLNGRELGREQVVLLAK